MRIDDLDTRRCVPGAENEILRQLRVHGLAWDGEPWRQSEGLSRYRLALDHLSGASRCYRCTCTRQRLRDSQRAGPDGPVYPGTCRGSGHAAGALRARLDSVAVELDEAGRCLRRESADVGDPVVARADGTPGYALASTVDESAMGITEIVRGGDLTGASFQQAALRPLLGLPALSHRHLPLLTDAHGRKLSKQNHAAPLDDGAAARNLRRCLELLGQEPGADPDPDTPARILAGAIERWRPERIPPPEPRVV